jgi:hypothetical protein
MKFSDEASCAKGAFGLVQFLELNKKNYAIKSIKFNPDKEQDFNRIYQEYFLCCLAHALKVGPKMYPLFGYDILVTNNTAYFAM